MYCIKGFPRLTPVQARISVMIAVGKIISGLQRDRLTRRYGTGNEGGEKINISQIFSICEKGYGNYCNNFACFTVHMAFILLLSLWIVNKIIKFPVFAGKRPMKIRLLMVKIVVSQQTGTIFSIRHFCQQFLRFKKSIYGQF